MMAITQPTWDLVPGYVGKNIKDICGNGLHGDALNHCAHFVSHALGISLGYTCQDQSGGKEDAASIRVHEIFSSSESVGFWEDKGKDRQRCLIFITNGNNVNLTQKIMINHPRKHIGLFIDGTVYHYSNSKDRVVKQTVVNFNGHYSSPFNTLFYGDLGKFTK